MNKNHNALSKGESMEYLTMKKKTNVLEHAFASSAGAYYNINLTRNLVPGEMYQVINDIEYSLNKQMGVSENARFTDVVDYWGEKLDVEERDAYYEFLSIPNLLEHYKRGETHVFHTYWTKSAIFEPMLAEQHIVMYEDEGNGDILGITYVLDLTQQYKEEKYKKELEEKQEKLEQALKEAEKVNQYREVQAAVETVDDILNKLNVLDKISNEDELEQMMPELLASLGHYSMSDRAYVFTWKSMESQILRMTHEWCADGVLPTMGEMQDLKLEEMPNWAPRLNRGEAIVYADWDAQKEKTPEEYALFDEQNIHSLIVIPIFANHKLNGYIGFCNPEQGKVALSVRLLSSIGSHISSLKDNFYMLRELEKKQESIKNSFERISRENAVLDALIIDYTSVYYCDLEKNTIFVLKQGKNTNAALTEQEIMAGLDTYSFRIQYYYDKFVVKESAPDFVYKLSPAYLKEYLSHHDRFAYRFRSYPNPAGQQYFEVQIVRLNSPGFQMVMGYRYIDDIITEQEKQQSQLEHALEEATLNSEIVNSISKLYWLIYRMDLVSGSYEEISAGQEMHRLTGKYGNTEEMFEEARRTIVCPEHQEMMKKFLDTSTLAERLREEESISIEYRAVNDSWHLARFIVKKRDSDGNVLNVLYVVRQIDKEKQRESQYKQELEEKNRVLSGLSLDYTTACVLNLDTDEYTFVFNQKTNHAKVMKNIEKFSDYVDQYAEHYALPEFKEPMRQTLNSENIKRRFETENEYHFSFETTPNEAGLSCFQAHIVKEYDGNGHFAFLGFRSADEIVEKECFYKEALEKANQALRQQLDMITGALPGGVKISNDDEQYSFKYVSEQFANMLGYHTPEELMKSCGGSIVGLAHPDDVKTGIADALEQYAKYGKYEVTYRVKCRDGSWKYIEDHGRKIYAPDGKVEHWCLILDKNELMQKTIALESEKKANQAKTDFLSRMSHDMRTPLNGIIGLIDICTKHPDDRELVDSSRRKARVAADHLLSLINDMLELSKLENKDTPLYEEKFHLRTLLHEVETIARMRADEENIAITYTENVDDIENPYLLGSPLYVKQILLNVITNAIKYNHKHGFVHCNVEEKILSEIEVELHFTIQDNGIGMKQSFLKDIFKPFVQEDDGPRSVYMGTGLGMAIVKKLLDRMDGRIQIESEEDVGTTVQIVLPFQIAAIDDPKENTQETADMKIQNIRVLLVEDNELNREIASFVLKDAGIDVIEAVDGQQAVDFYMEKPVYYFDAVLMDIMMPVMDGYEATHAIRNSEKEDAKSIPIIAMTANAFDDDRKKSKAAGMDAHLSKPLDIQKMIETIGNLCDKNKCKTIR